jgi:hypothetical protein
MTPPTWEHRLPAEVQAVAADLFRAAIRGGMKRPADVLLVVKTRVRFDPFHVTEAEHFAAVRILAAVTGDRPGALEFAARLLQETPAPVPVRAARRVRR